MQVSFSDMLESLAALAEPTRLRIVALLADAELTVTELTTILGQSQPRVSRHLKLLVDAGLIERNREGAWAFFRLADTALALASAGQVLSGLDLADVVLVDDRVRLADVRSERAKAAESYFARHAGEWDRLRAMHVAEKEVEAAILAAAGEGPFQAVLDLGTGTGSMLSLLAPRAVRAVGVDASHAMLAVARAKLDAAGQKNVQLRQADIYALPVERGAYDLIVIHQVLHYLDDPARAIREAAKSLRPGGRMIVVDFAPHAQEALRDSHAHRRLGFSHAEIDTMLGEAGLQPVAHNDLPPSGEGQLTVSLWTARDPRILDDRLFGVQTVREVA